MPTVNRTRPVPDTDSAPFWEACRRHELRVQRCEQCGMHRWPPRGICPRCHSWNAQWVRLSGRGTVSSYVAVHHGTDEPYAVVHVDLAETDGLVRMTSNLVDVPVDDVRVGMVVEAVFEDLDDEIALPMFRAVLNAG